MLTFKERDYIPCVGGVDETSSLSFKPHITQRLAVLDHPKTSIDHELHHTLRSSCVADERPSPPLTLQRSASTLDYDLWLEAGKQNHKPLYPKNLDGKPPINFNIWRNFRRYYSGLGNDNKREKTRHISDMTAFSYPITIPAPSVLGDNHLRQYFESNWSDLFKNQKRYRMALIKADSDERLLRLLSLKSEQRNPNSIESKRHRESEQHSVPLKKPSIDVTSPLSQSVNGGRATDLLAHSSQQRQNSLNASFHSPTYEGRLVHSMSGKKFLLKENHPSIDKLKFEQELKTAVDFHRELTRINTGSEKSIYAKHF
ncbi:unnamed protein product [Didymodactylos carnosus]|uniref:Uncharacterized protein n=1 Tax=Didymodactylos carnosus TaxID=1234261 RepID=A0A814I3Y3_9BILA|nr:unnamed protein product [Didymodactylos carnosus]CAF1018472.1 unnamed protein product [Didymodactylos carnosus]CAF3760588.1 unnamed protein product [Didymodactylos carnosus]CAF3789951.1 unnamed protein product [Didymodactylos carnosus]